MSDRPNDFQVFVKPAGARCNLACRYCYYLDKSAAAGQGQGNRMGDAVLEEYIVQHIAASAGADLFFSWHGGEPLLAGMDFYRKVTDLQKRSVPAGRGVINALQTNATLIDDRWGCFLRDEGFYVGVSLDGPARFHDSNRRSRDGSGTFDAVMRGINILRAYELPYEILCVVNSENVRSPLELYRFFRSLGAGYITFLPLVEREAENGVVTARSVTAIDFGRFLTAVFDEWITNDIGRIKIQIFEEALRTAFGQEHSLCIFRPVCGAVPVVEMNGDFYSCDHYVDEAHLIGNIMNRSLQNMLADTRQKAFGEMKRAGLPRYCLECEVLEMCNGECPKNRFIDTPEGEPGLNWLCEGYRYFFNHCRPFVNEVSRVWKGGIEQ